MAARVRRELDVQVDLVRGRRGEYVVLVEGDVVINAKKLPGGHPPSSHETVDALKPLIRRSVPTEG